MRNTGNRNDALTALRRALQAERDKVAAAGSTTLQALAAAQFPAEDQASVLHEQYLALARHTQDRERLDLIDAALDRVNRGDYGICQECDGEISSKRLQAMPWALRCVHCQERFESAHGAWNGAMAATA